MNAQIGRRLQDAHEAAAPVSGTLLRLALLFLGVLLAGVLVREAARDTIVILPFEIGATAQEAGLSQAAVTRWFADEMLKIGEIARSRVRDHADVTFERLPQDFTIAATGLSARALVENVRYYLGTWRTVSGELTYTGNQLTLSVRVTGRPSSVFERLAEPSDLATGARLLTGPAAIFILEQISPFHGAAYHVSRGAEFYGDAERNIFAALRTGTPQEQAAATNLWGLMALRQKDYAAAAARFDRAVAVDPSLALAVANRGVVAEEQGDWAGALDYYGRAVAMDQASAVAVGNFGRALCRAQRCDQGLRYLRTAVALEPRNPEVAINVGVGLTAGGRFAEAEAAHVEATFAHPGEPQAFFALGRFHQERLDGLAPAGSGTDAAALAELDRHLAGAERAYARAVQLAPSNRSLWLDYGNVFWLRVTRQRAADPGEALHQAYDAYSKAIELDDRVVLAYRNRGLINVMRNQPTAALVDLTRALELQPTNPDLHCAIAEAYAAIGDGTRERASRAECRASTP